MAIGPKMSSSRSGRYSRLVMLVLIAAALGGLLWAGIARDRKVALLRSPNPIDSAAATSSVFSPARESFYDAFREYLGLQSTPVQPIAFNHKIHLEKGLKCA